MSVVAEAAPSHTIDPCWTPAASAQRRANVCVKSKRGFGKRLKEKARDSQREGERERVIMRLRERDKCQISLGI